MNDIINVREKTLKRNCQGEFKFTEYEVRSESCGKHSYILICHEDNVLLHTDKSLFDKLIEDENSDVFLYEEDFINIKEVFL